MNELEIVEQIRNMASRGPCIELGIGDDCAIFRPRPGEDLLFTTDQMIEDVHFQHSHPPASVGERALARSLSDIAAMGGEPRFCLVSLAAAESRHNGSLDFYRGLLGLARRTETALAGGDLAHVRNDLLRRDGLRRQSPRGKALRRDGARVR